jgi:hypothetical protein
MALKNLAEYDLRRYARDLISSSRRILRYEIGLIRGNGYTLREYLQEPAFKRRPYLKPAGFSSHTGSCCLTVIASSLFPRTPLGASSGLGAFRATPGAPHLESRLRTSCI